MFSNGTFLELPAGNQIGVGYDATFALDVRPIMTWDVSEIPANVVVTGASLVLFQQPGIVVDPDSVFLLQPTPVNLDINNVIVEQVSFNDGISTGLFDVTGRELGVLSNRGDFFRDPFGGQVVVPVTNAVQDVLIDSENITSSTFANDLFQVRLRCELEVNSGGASLGTAPEVIEVLFPADPGEEPIAVEKFPTFGEFALDLAVLEDGDAIDDALQELIDQLEELEVGDTFQISYSTLYGLPQSIVDDLGFLINNTSASAGPKLTIVITSDASNGVIIYTAEVDVEPLYVTEQIVAGVGTGLLVFTPGPEAPGSPFTVGTITIPGTDATFCRARYSANTLSPGGDLNQTATPRLQVNFGVI
ncbi:MAG: hypothetical protein ACFCU9_06660 [Cyanophyceae cyanobacterium]